MQINLGNRELSTMTQSELYELLKIDGLFKNDGIKSCNEIVKHWHDCIIDEVHWCDLTYWFKGHHIRISDNFKVTFEGYVAFDDGDFSVLYENSVRTDTYFNYLKLKSINHLIELGFNLPLSSYNKP